LTAHALDHEFELDRARERRAKANELLRAANNRTNGLFEMLRRRMDAASRARDRVAAEAVRANDHVQELKAAVRSLREEAERVRQEKVVAAHTLTRVRDELKTGVRRLHGTDPRLMEHLLGIITGAERTYLQSAMAKAIQVMQSPAESATDQGKSGPPAKPSRSGMGPGR
jgi:chromosome segregation ATPase